MVFIPMSLFFIAFFLLYSALHSYLFLKLKHAFHLGLKTGAFVALFMLIMILAPFMVRMAEKGGQECLARFIAYTGYTWMAFVFLFFASSLVIDLFRFFVYLTGLALKRDFLRPVGAGVLFFMVPFMCALSITVYGYFEAQRIRVERVSIKSPKIPKGSTPIKIVQITDVHMGLIMGKKRIEPIISAIKYLDPHILVSTGDLIDGRFNRLNEPVDLFASINPPLGKYAVTGNHEFYAGVASSVDFMEKAGFIVLRGRGCVAGGIVNIAGVDDLAGVNFESPYIQEKTLLTSLPRENFTVLLKHRPIIEDGATGLFDLQLSGHTHKGQIYPFSYIVKLYFPLNSGFHRINGTSVLYTSRGTGTWGPPIRFLAPPEITLIELSHGE